MSQSQSGSRTSTPRNDKKRLPNGWMVVPSKSYPDRIYYYNTISKCSTWENPCVDFISQPETSPEQEARTRNNKRKYDDSFKPSVPKSAFATDDDSIEDYDEDHNDYFDNVPMNNFSLRRNEMRSRSPLSPKSPIAKFFTSSVKPDPPISKVIPNEEPKELWTHFLNPTVNRPKKKKSLVLSDLETSSNKTSEASPKLSSPPRKKIIRSRALDTIVEQVQKSPVKKDRLNLPRSSYNPNNEKLPITSRLTRIPRVSKSLGSDACNMTNSSPLSDIYSNEKKTPAQNRLARVRVQNVETVLKAVKKNKYPKATVEKTVRNNNRSPKKLTLDQLTDKKQTSIGKRFQRLRKKALKEAEEYLASQNLSLEEGKILASSPSDKKKKVIFVGETTNEFLQTEPINVTQYVDEFPEEEMDWEPSDEQEMIKHINHIRKNLSKEAELSNLIYLSDQNMERSESTEVLLYIVVVDTNILLSSLTFVKDLRDTKINDLGYPVIYIPWRVLQELDHLKDSPELKVGARRAIRYINENFIACHPRFRGQSFQEFSTMSKSESESPDDDILQSCLHLQKKETDKRLILLTNDKNFESKAILCGIKAYSKERFQKEVNLSDQRLSIATSNNHVNNLIVGDNDQKFCQLKALLKNLFVTIVEIELKLAYGEDWKKIVKNQDWTLSDLIDCFIRYWKSVFGFVFPKDVLSEMENLKKALNRNVVGKDVNNIFRISQLLLSNVKRCKEIRPYMEKVDTSLEDINLLLNSKTVERTPEHSIIQCSSASPSIDGSVSSHDIVPQIKQEGFFSPAFCDAQIHIDKVKHLFKVIWNHTRTTAYTVGNVMSPEHSCEMDQPTLTNMKNQLPEINSNLEEFITAIENVILLNLTDITPTNPAIINLSNILLKLAMSINVSMLDLMPIESLGLSVAIFCGEVSERELLNKSLNDFKEFHRELVNGFEYIRTMA